jgi:hypothetical protein
MMCNLNQAALIPMIVRVHMTFLILDLDRHFDAEDFQQHCVGFPKVVMRELEIVQQFVRAARLDQFLEHIHVTFHSTHVVRESLGDRAGFLSGVYFHDAHFHSFSIHPSVFVVYAGPLTILWNSQNSAIHI